VHPLLVIFALLAGQQLYGFAGVFVTLPLLAIGRELFRFLSERIGLETWGNGPLPVEVPVEVHGPRAAPPPTVPGRRPATAGRTAELPTSDCGVGAIASWLDGARSAASSNASSAPRRGPSASGTCRTSGRPWPARASSRSAGGSRRSRP
jgi:hypothetical protein